VSLSIDSDAEKAKDRAPNNKTVSQTAAPRATARQNNTAAVDNIWGRYAVQLHCHTPAAPPDPLQHAFGTN
jgi:hypothetical protein